MNFKSQICTFLVFFLLISQIDRTFSVHFCGDSIASVSVDTNSKNVDVEKKCCGDVEKDSKCCHNKHIKSSEKLEVVFLKSLSFLSEFTFNSFTWKPFKSIQKPIVKTTKLLSYFCDLHPPPIYKTYCKLIFYA